MSCKNGCDRCQCGNTRGERGIQGEKGTAGAQGVAGSNGDTGPIGPAGPGGGGLVSNEMIYQEAEIGSFLVPPGVTELIVELWGGGAGARIYKTTEELMLIAGGGGGYIKKIVATSPGTFIPFTVGAGGGITNGAPPNVFTGAAGENTTFGTLIGAGATISTLTLGTPNNLQVSRGGGYNANVEISEFIEGSSGSVIFCPVTATPGIYENGHAIAGSGAKSGRSIAPNGTEYTTINGAFTQENPGDGGTCGCKFDPITVSMDYFGSFGLDGRIVVRWKE